MSENWLRLGLVFNPDGKLSWLKSHASTPFVVPLTDSRVRVYFSGRDERNRSNIGAIDLDLSTLQTKLVSEKPLVTFGDENAFDRDGASMGALVTAGTKCYLYYVGWNLRKDIVGWSNTIGLAISNDSGKTFEKYDKNPIMKLDKTDPYTLSYPWVEHQNDRWVMWYGTDIAAPKGDKATPHAVRKAVSNDGIHWERSPDLSIRLKEGEYAVARPTILREQDEWSMWYAYKAPHSEYKIGKAVSRDGATWARHDEGVKILGKPQPWEAEAQCYPCVFRSEGETFMLYNGNRFGATGFGLARRMTDGLHTR